MGGFGFELSGPGGWRLLWFFAELQASMSKVAGESLNPKP